MGEKSSHSLWLSLNDTNYNGSEIIEILSKDKKLSELFIADAGVWEGYSIQEHTLLVYQVFAEQFNVYNQFYNFSPNREVRFWPLMKILIALHDIGKPIAIKNGDKSEQHKYTMDILSEKMTAMNFNDHEIKLAIALVGHDHIGKMIKKDKEPLSTKEKIQKQAELADHSLESFFPIQAFYYCIDAAAYPGLRKRIFTTKNQLLVPISERYNELHQLILNKRIY